MSLGNRQLVEIVTVVENVSGQLEGWQTVGRERRVVGEASCGTFESYDISVGAANELVESDDEVILGSRDVENPHSLELH